VNIFNCFDKVGLPQDEIHLFRLFNAYCGQVHPVPPDFFGELTQILLLIKGLVIKKGVQVLAPDTPFGFLVKIGN
jgi:hypothetical protein